MLLHDGDPLGRTVTIAARLADEAWPGELLTTGDLAASAGTALPFRNLGPVQIKALAERVALLSFEPG